MFVRAISSLSLLFLALVFSGAHFARGVDPPTVLLSGKQVVYPQIGLGCASGVRHSHLLTAISNGYRLLDTAQAYVWGYNEDDVGKAVVDSGVDRGDIYIQTKIHPEDLGYDATLRAFNNSLKRLQTPYVDSLLLHKPRCWAGACSRTPEGTWQDSWTALEKLYDDGLVRAIGICDVDAGIFAELMKKRIKPHVIQNWMDPFHQDKATRALCKQHGVVYQAYSTLGTQWKHQIGENPVMSNPKLERIAQAHQRSVTQVILNWAMQNGAAVIPASKDASRQAQNLQSADFSLTPQDIKDIDELENYVKITISHYFVERIETFFVDSVDIGSEKQEQETTVGWMEPGKKQSLNTAAGHKFRFKMGQTVVGEYVVASGRPVQQHVIKTKGQEL